VTQEVNENRHDIIEIKSHLGLPADTYHELPQFDDPFPEWDAMDEAAVTATHAPLPRPCHRTRPPTRSCRSPPSGQEILDEDEETEEEEPRDYCRCFTGCPPRGIPEVVSLGEETLRSGTRSCNEHKI
jgi:hypothetical protein